MTRVPDVMTWLRAGIPLTLVIDLLDERGPDSEALLKEKPRVLVTSGWDPQTASAALSLP